MTARTKESDPLVPLDPERLREALKSSGLTANALAKKAGVRQQTLDAMLHASGGGKTRHCRRSHRDRLARALNLPEYESNGSRWLGGEDRDLYQSVMLFDEGGARFSYQRSPVAVDLARLRLVERCRVAWARDKEQPHDSTVPPRPANIGKDARFFLLQGALEQLTSCIWWRNLVLQRDAFPPTRAEYEAHLQTLPEDQRRAVVERLEQAHGRPPLWDEMSAEEREDWLKWSQEPSPPPLSLELANRIERAFIEAFEALLEPWLSGEAQLRYRALLALRSSRPPASANG